MKTSSKSGKAIKAVLPLFFDNDNIQEIARCKNVIEEIKQSLWTNPYANSKEFTKGRDDVFETARLAALALNDEEMANSVFVAKQYYATIHHLKRYYECIKMREYSKSWGVLQDSIDSASLVMRFTNAQSALEIPAILTMLHSYERLYSYSFFFSIECVGHTVCSICSKPLDDPSCRHLVGELYWGELALSVYEEIESTKAIALVSHPKDKRCVVQFSDKDRPETEVYKCVHDFFSVIEPLQEVELIERRRKDDPQEPRNIEILVGAKIKRSRIHSSDQ